MILMQNDLEERILEWYDKSHRHLPWRAEPGDVPNPYHVLLSEIMLQQTTVGTVLGYFPRFIERWATLSELAKADLQEVYHCWQGLGYYSRAKNLHRCAQEIESEYQGKIPMEEVQLLKLSGIGPYTASAIAAIAFEQPTVPVDGNIVRVFSRLLNLVTPLPQLKEEIYGLVKEYIPTKRRGDFAQGLMDLGATICKPKAPRCDICPCQKICNAYKQSINHSFSVDSLPTKEQKAPKPKKYGIIFWYETPEGHVWLRKRPSKGLLANLIEIPGTLWGEVNPDLEQELAKVSSSSESWRILPGQVSHTFTHFHLSLTVVMGQGDNAFGDFPCPPAQFKDHALPTLMKKVINHVNLFCEQDL